MKKPFIIPKNLDIAGQKIKIRIRDFDGELYGQFHFDRKTIDIDSKIATDRKLFIETMRHEVFEACLLLSGVGWGEKYDQEQVVRCMDELCYPAMEKLEKVISKLNPQFKFLYLNTPLPPMENHSGAEGDPDQFI